MSLFSNPGVITVVALAMIWSPVSFAAENPTPLELVQELETVLSELESAQGPLHPDLVAPLQTMVESLREQSEFERAAEMQDRMLDVMLANVDEQSPGWIPSLREMVADQAISSATDGVDDLLRSLRILNAAKGDLPELIHMIELEAHWLMTGGAGITREQRNRSFMRAQEILANRYEYLIGELFEKNDPRIIPWRYHLAKNKHQLGELLTFEYGVDNRTRKSLEVQFPQFFYYELKLNSPSYLQDIGELFSVADDLEGQAMAKIYEADLTLPTSRSRAFELYGEAQEMLRAAEVPEERIRLYFSRPQLIPISRFHSTLEEAIAQQEADLAAWRPEQQGEIHIGTFSAWNETSPVLAAPDSDHVFWDSSSTYSELTVEFNISSAGRTSSVGFLDEEADDEEIRRRVRRVVLSKRFRPAMVEGRGQRLRDVQMRVLLPGPEG